MSNALTLSSSAALGPWWLIGVEGMKLGVKGVEGCRAVVIPPWEFEVIMGMLLFVGDIVPMTLRFDRGIYGV